MRTLVRALALALLAAGCMPHASEVLRDPHAKEVETALEHSEPVRASPGSLWSGAGLFGDAKAAHVGDLLTIVIEETAAAKRQVSMDTSKSSKHTSSINALLGFEKSLAAKNKNFQPGLALDTADARSFKGGGNEAANDTIRATLTAVVTKVYPNGTMRIVGRKTIVLHGHPQVIEFTGLVRPNDIGPDNTVPSSKVAQAAIRYGGAGDLENSVHKGWLTRTLEEIWPF